MATEQITDHGQRALDRLPEQFKEQPNLASYLAVFTDQVQDIEDAFWQLFVERSIDTAVGAQLDMLGVIVGQEREGRADEDYRRLIRARIKTNRSSGTINELATITRLVLNDSGYDLEFRNDGIATLVLRILNQSMTDATAEILMSFLGRAVAGGVRIILEYTAVAPSNLLQFDLDQFDQEVFANAIDNSDLL